MSEPRLNHFLPDVEEALTKARNALKAASWCCEKCHRSVSDALRPYLAGGQPPSDGMPSEDTDELAPDNDPLVQRGVMVAVKALCGKLQRDNQRLQVDCNALRLALRSGLPDCLGCGKSFHTFVDAYRCTHCDAYLHKDCAERHFAKQQSLDELERQIASDAYAATFQTLGQYRSGLLAAIREIRAYRA